MDWFTFSYKKFSLFCCAASILWSKKRSWKKRIMMRSFFIRFSFSVWETFTLLRVAIANYENSSKGSVLYDHEFSTCLFFHHHSLTRVKELKMIHGKSSKNQINICKKGRNRFFKTFFFNLRSLIKAKIIIRRTQFLHPKAKSFFNFNFKLLIKFKKIKYLVKKM